MTRRRGERRAERSRPEHSLITPSGTLRRSGLLLRVAAWVFLPPWGWVWAFSLFRYSAPLEGEILYAGLALFSLALVIRSGWVGVRVDADRLIVRQWFRTAIIEREKIRNVVVKPYVGFLTGWQLRPSAINSHFMMLGWEDAKGRRRFFPSTIASYGRTRAQAALIAERLGVAHTSETLLR